MSEQIEKILAQLEDHEKRIQAIEGIMAKNPTVEQLENKEKTKAKIKGEDLFPPIQKLLKDGFFKDWQTDLDVCNALTIKLLTKKKPLRASVVNVLRSMVKKDLLNREKIKKDKKVVLSYHNA